MMPTLSEYSKLTRADIARLQHEKLGRLVEIVRESNSFQRQKMAAVPRHGFELSQIPFTTRAEIERDQADHPPYGTNLTYPLEDYIRLHQTSGSLGTPVRLLDTAACWEWWKTCWSAVYAGANVTTGDVALFTFSFGPFVGFWAAFETASALGVRCLAAGGMTTEARLRHLLDHRATVLCCTPTYALHLIEAARRANVDLATCPVRAIIVAGEPGGNIPSTRLAIETAFGAHVFDHAGMTEIGAWGFEDMEAPGALTILETEFIAESFDPATGKPAADGEIGELVLTNLGRLGMPLIRYRTGDLVRLSRTPEGRTPFARAVGGVLGRADDMLVVRGNNVFPSAIEGMLRELKGLAEFRIEVGGGAGMNELTLVLEPALGTDAAELMQSAERVIRDRLHFRPVVRCVGVGELPRFEMKARRVLRK